MVAGVAMAGVHSYTNQSVLSTGTFVKVSVKETGVHSISYETLKEWGLNPEKVAVLGYGGAMLTEDFRQHHWDDVPVVPIYMHTGTDTVFNSGDYILFYAHEDSYTNPHLFETIDHILPHLAESPVVDPLDL